MKKAKKSVQSLTIKRITRVALPILKKNGVVKAGIFGSYARGEAKRRSDIDILIKQKGRKGLLNLVQLQFQLEDKLRKKVDLLDYTAINPYIKNQILNEEVKIL